MPSIHAALIISQMKWLHFSGTLSRVIGPIWAGYAFYYGYIGRDWGTIFFGTCSYVFFPPFFARFE
jgi:hypothetical protein